MKVWINKATEETPSNGFEDAIRFAMLDEGPKSNLKVNFEEILRRFNRESLENIYEDLITAAASVYSGNEKFIELGCFFSVNSNMIRSNTGKQIINQIPINRIFVESDGSFTKVLGRKYTVEKLSVIYEELAYVKKIDEVDV